MRVREIGNVAHIYSSFSSDFLTPGDVISSEPEVLYHYLSNVNCQVSSRHLSFPHTKFLLIPSLPWIRSSLPSIFISTSLYLPTEPLHLKHQLGAFERQRKSMRQTFLLNTSDPLQRESFKISLMLWVPRTSTRD